MTAKFQNLMTDEVIEVKDISLITTGCECLGAKGYGVNYTDGTFNLYRSGSWQLICISAK